MADLISVLVITFTIGGTVHERELPMSHVQCMAAQSAITAAKRKDRPRVELNNGRRVPVKSATCIPACFTDGLPALDLLTRSEDA